MLKLFSPYPLMSKAWTTNYFRPLLNDSINPIITLLFVILLEHVDDIWQLLMLKPIFQPWPEQLRLVYHSKSAHHSQLIVQPLELVIYYPIAQLTHPMPINKYINNYVHFLIKQITFLRSKSSFKIPGVSECVLKSVQDFELTSETDDSLDLIGRDISN